jgi:hypothetical protein
VTGDRFWNCHQLIAVILRHLLGRYGPDIVIVPGDDTGVDEVVKRVAKGMRLKNGAHLADSTHLDADRFRYLLTVIGLSKESGARARTSPLALASAWYTTQ